MTYKPAHSQKGFTLVEVGVIVPILIVIALVLFDVLYSMVSSSITEQTKMNLMYDKQTALNIIEGDSALASTYISTTDPGLVDPYPTANYSGTWSYEGASATDRVLIMRVFSTTTNPLMDGPEGRQPVFIGDPSGPACSSANLYLNQVEEYNVIFFVKNNNLYRRRIVDTATQYCNPGQYQKLSCPTQDDLTAAGSGARSSLCKANDELLVSDVVSFVVNYYDSKTSSTPLNVYAPGADPELIESAVDIDISLTLEKTVMGAKQTTSSKLRMTKLNTKVDSV